MCPYLTVCKLLADNIENANIFVLFFDVLPVISIVPMTSCMQNILLRHFGEWLIKLANNNNNEEISGIGMQLHDISLLLLFLVY